MERKSDDKSYYHFYAPRRLAETDGAVLRAINYGNDVTGRVPHRGLLLRDLSLPGVRADIRARLELYTATPDFSRSKSMK